MSNWIFRTATNEELYQILIRPNVINCYCEECGATCYFLDFMNSKGGICKLFGKLRKSSRSVFRHDKCRRIFNEL